MHGAVGHNISCRLLAAGHGTACISLRIEGRGSLLQASPRGLRCRLLPHRLAGGSRSIVSVKCKHCWQAPAGTNGVGDPRGWQGLRRRHTICSSSSSSAYS